MKYQTYLRNFVFLAMTCCLLLPIFVFSQALKTPLSQEILSILTNEISGQFIFNNEVLLAGAPWLRDKSEFEDTFYESGKIYEIAKNYGIKTVELRRQAREGTFEYPVDGEFWIVEPELRMIARLGADAALVARGTQTCDVSGELIYIPPLEKETIEALMAAGEQEKYKDRIALMWSHARGDLAKALDIAGLKGVISFSSRDRYFDPNQVVYGSGSYREGKNLQFGFSVSWRQWSELLEDLEAHKKLVVRCKAHVEKYKNKLETVFSWIPGTEPDKKGVVFSAHLFEGYTKRGANDNMSGCVIQLEILRALTKLIAEGILPQPRRTIYFIWPNEISGTYEFIKQNSQLVDKWSININMDMVGESLRKSNSWFTMSECPNFLPSYLDGLAKSIMNYVWRSNDIVYLRDVPRGRPGGQYFPIPMMEKNGTIDAFRFFIHTATGGSDHICFNNSSVAVPGVEFFTWPDQWYHADTDTPDKSDPTQMKRVAFIGAACAYAAAHCTDEVLPGLLAVASEFGYQRIAEREHIKALRYVDAATKDNLGAETQKALNLAQFATGREIDALRSIEDIYTGSSSAKALLSNRIKQWELYAESIESQILKYAAIRADLLDVAIPKKAKKSSLEKKYEQVFPSIHPDVKNQKFSLTGDEKYKEYIAASPKAIEDLKLSSTLTRAALNYVNGRRSITKIRDCIAAETEEEVSLESVAAYLEILKLVNWVVY